MNLICQTFSHAGGNPTVCVRCKRENSAEGYYESGMPSFGDKPCRIGICRGHKKHGGAKIMWYEKSRSK